MKQFTNPVPQFFDNDGNILSGGSIGFYENGSTTTKKNTYNADGGVLNTNPVVLSAEGRLPQVWGDGLYTVICRKKPVSPYTDPEDGEVVWTRNGYEFGANDGQFTDWNAVENVELNDFRKYDGKYYRSEISGNIGNVPDVSTNKWSQIAFLDYWNADKPNGYAEGSIVIDEGRLYRSKINNNESLTSVADDWQSLSFNNYIDGDLEVNGNVTTTHEGVALRKTTLSIVSDTSLNRDPELTVSGLVTGWYLIIGQITWASNGGGAANRIQLTFDGDGTTSEQKIVWQDFESTSLSSLSTVTTPNFQNPGGNDRILTFNGMIRLDSGGSLGLWVSQFASSILAIDIKAGSLYVKRIGDGV